jgi:hypothetical protein
MSAKKEKLIASIERLKKKISEVGPMMPGSLSQQTRKNSKGETYGSYWKLGFTYKMKSRSYYINEELVDKVENWNKEFRNFKQLTEEWIELSLKLAEMELTEAKLKG